MKPLIIHEVTPTECFGVFLDEIDDNVSFTRDYPTDDHVIELITGGHITKLDTTLEKTQFRTDPLDADIIMADNVESMIGSTQPSEVWSWNGEQWFAHVRDDDEQWKRYPL